MPRVLQPPGSFHSLIHLPQCQTATRSEAQGHCAAQCATSSCVPGHGHGALLESPKCKAGHHAVASGAGTRLGAEQHFAGARQCPSGTLFTLENNPGVFFFFFSAAHNDFREFIVLMRSTLGHQPSSLPAPFICFCHKISFFLSSFFPLRHQLNHDQHATEQIIEEVRQMQEQLAQLDEGDNTAADAAMRRSGPTGQISSAALTVGRRFVLRRMCRFFPP